MSLPLIIDKTFKNENYTITALTKAEYDSCTFINCDFSESYISGISFLDCSFIDCNLSLVKTKETTFKDVSFENCKLLGTPFHDCSPFLFSVSFDTCTLNLASFYGLKLPKTHFKACTFEQTDFTNSILSYSIFDSCNLHMCLFDNTNIEYADFRTSKHIAINPGKNRIKHAKFSKENALGLLASFNINIQ